MSKSKKLYPPIGRRRIESALIQDMIFHMWQQPDNWMYARDEVIRWLKLWLPKNIYKKICNAPAKNDTRKN